MSIFILHNILKEEHSTETLSRSSCLSSTLSSEASTKLGMQNSQPLEVNLTDQPLTNSFLEFDCQELSEDPKPEANTKYTDVVRKLDYTCKTCAKSFDDAKYLKSHNQLYHGKSLYQQLLQSLKPQCTFY